MMPKKKTKRPPAKAKPSKPSKGTGGGGRAKAKPAFSRIESGPEKNSALPKVVQPNLGHPQFSPLGDLAEYEALRRKAYQKAAALSESDRFVERIIGHPEPQIAQDAPMYAASEALEAEVDALEEHLLNRIERGEIFLECPGSLVRAVMRRIHSLLSDERTRGAGEGHLADVVSQIISSRSVNPKTVWPWIAKHTSTEAFQFEWSYNRRKTSRGLNRILFTFAIQKIAELDVSIEKLLEESGLMNARTASAEAAAVTSFEKSVKAGGYAPGKSLVLHFVLEKQKAEWHPLRPAVYEILGSDWKQAKRYWPLDCAEL